MPPDYRPWDFVANWWGKTWWGSDEDKELLRSELATVRGNFSVPVLVGEYGTSLLGQWVTIVLIVAWLKVVSPFLVAWKKPLAGLQVIFKSLG